MTDKQPLGLFFTGTDTDAGKTYVTALVARNLRAAGLRVGVYKPVASGCFLQDGRLISDDAVALWEAAGRPADWDRVCPQRFEAPLAPPQAAACAGRAVDADLMLSGARWWQGRCDILLVEGAGGLMCPLADDWLCSDLAHALGLPLVVVAANRLGVINHTLVTITAAAGLHGGLDVAGIVLCDTTPHTDASASTNAAAIRQRSPVPLLGHVPYGAAELARPVDWLQLAQPLGSREAAALLGRGMGSSGPRGSRDDARKE